MYDGCEPEKPKEKRRKRDRARELVDEKVIFIVLVVVWMIYTYLKGGTYV